MRFFPLCFLETAPSQSAERGIPAATRIDDEPWPQQGSRVRAQKMLLLLATGAAVRAAAAAELSGEGARRAVAEQILPHEARHGGDYSREELENWWAGNH